MSPARRIFAPCERVLNKTTGKHEKQSGVYVLHRLEQRGASAVRNFDRSVSCAALC
jgi:hypothetical protein